MAPSYFKEQYQSGLNITISENIMQSLRPWLMPHNATHYHQDEVCQHHIMTMSPATMLFLKNWATTPLSLRIIYGIHLIILLAWWHHNLTHQMHWDINPEYQVRIQFHRRFRPRRWQMVLYWKLPECPKGLRLDIENQPRSFNWWLQPKLSKNVK